MKLQFVLVVSALVSGVLSVPHGGKHDKDEKENFDLVGYAKSNPIGVTTGGKKGATTTVRDAAALATAVAVSIFIIRILNPLTKYDRATNP